MLCGVFLTSFGLLGFEITLTRLLSVILSYHYVFAVVSLALLGLGVGGIFIYFFRPKAPGGHNRFSSLTLFVSLCSLTMVFSTILVAQIGHIDSIRGNILVYCFVLCSPFFFSGAFLAEVFQMYPAMSARMYGADLVGAAAGCIGVILALDILDGVRTIFLFAGVTSIAALTLGFSNYLVGALMKNIRGVIIAVASFLIASALLGASLIDSYLPDIPIGINPEKEIHNALYGSQQGKIIETRWSAFGQTDLVKFTNNPEHMDIYIDGTAGTPMYRFSGDFNDPGSTIDNLKVEFPGYFPFMFLQEEEKDHALTIGPGGGRDILLAIMGGVHKITAVEVNKDLVNMVRKYSWYNGGIYSSLSNVDIIVDEGRNFLKRQKEPYDIIMLSLPATNTSRSPEGYAITENFLLTTDSISDYLDHLTDEGCLVVVAHGDISILRLFSISLTALNQRGVNTVEAMKHIYTVGSAQYPVFVLKKKQLETQDAVAMFKTIYKFGYDPSTSYFPYIRQLGMLNPALMALGNGNMAFNDLETMVKERGHDVSPVTDNSPFFYKFEVGTPKPVTIVFWSSLIVMLLVVLAPLLYWKKRHFRTKKHSKSKGIISQNPVRYVVVFSMLGIGFMLVEISFAQRFVLFLGQPVISLAVLLFSLLVGAGMGSISSSRLVSDKIIKGIALAALAIVAMLLIYTLLLPFIFNQFLGLDLIIRLLAAVVILTLLGFVMGFPFPLAIRSLKEMEMESHIPWMWGINGISSVLGSALTIVIAINFGFTEALLVGAGCYFIVFLLFKNAI